MDKTRATTDHARLIERVRAQLAAQTGEDVQTITTHAAIILLAGGRALKIKRPVAFSFLDFSTADARRKALEHELDLNRRTAADIYKSVLPINAEGRLAGPGEPVEWALEMARFDNDQRLDRLLDGGLVDDARLDRLARHIASFHEQLTEIHLDQLTAMRIVVDGNAEDLRRSVPAILERAMIERLIDVSQRALEEQSIRLQQRTHEGWVRHCHGDLHSENVVLIDDEPVLFDCIEFNDDFAHIDLLYDVAFLVMDLAERGHARAAWRVLQGYLDRMPQDDGLALLPLFLSIRAAIRAKVEAFASHDAKAGRYARFALACLEPAKPRLVAIGGLSGTGKTTIARALAPGLSPMPGAVHLRSDLERKRLFGVEALDPLPDKAYRPKVSERVFALLAKRAATLMAAGRSVIVDAVYARPEQRADIAEVAHSARLPFSGFWLDATTDLRAERVTDRRGDASDANADIARSQEGYDLGEIDWHRVDAGRSSDAVVADIRRQLGCQSAFRVTRDEESEAVRAKHR